MFSTPSLKTLSALANLYLVSPNASIALGYTGKFTKTQYGSLWQVIVNWAIFPG